jgi:hypothetical protein
LFPLGSSFAEFPFSLNQMPMSHRSGPDSMVASTVIMNGVGSVGSQVDGPAMSSIELIRTSFAVQDGLPPIVCVMQALLLDWANAGVEAAIADAAKTTPHWSRKLLLRMRRCNAPDAFVDFVPIGSPSVVTRIEISSGHS